MGLTTAKALVPNLFPPRLLPMSPNYLIFTLTINGVDPANDPIRAMLHGRDRPEDWRYFGFPIPGERTRNFMWVVVDHQSTARAICHACRRRARLASGSTACRIPEGQWLLAVARKYQSDRMPRAVADTAWYNENGAHLPFIVDDTGPHLLRVKGSIFNDWRWLVEVL